MELTEDDVLEILKLFEQSKFDFLELQHGERRITVSKAGAGTAPAHVVAPVPSASSPPPTPATRPVPRASPAAPRIEAPGLVPITAPMVGKFYASPSPADPPYVQPGSVVAAGTTIGLIEVMKVFTSIKTESAGTIEQILVASGDYVEFGQTLFLLRTDSRS